MACSKTKAAVSAWPPAQLRGSWPALKLWSSADLHRVLGEDQVAGLRDAVHLLDEQPQQRSGPLRGLGGASVAGMPPCLQAAGLCSWLS